MGNFKGFGRGAEEFFAELSQNNQKSWFEANKPRYQKEVLEPAAAMIEALGPKLEARQSNIFYDPATNGRGSIFRIHRDVRFSKDKSPYKTHMGILLWLDILPKKMENPGFYFQVDAQGIQCYLGLYGLDKTRLAAYRTAVSKKAPAEELAGIFKKLHTQGLETGEVKYKRPPKGFEPDHDQKELLLYGSVWAHLPKMNQKDRQGAQLIEKAEEFFTQSQPLLNWLENNLY